MLRNVLNPESEITPRPNQAFPSFQLRPLSASDGMALHRLVQVCTPLDTNSTYCNLLQCSHFGDTSIGAFRAGELIGSVTAYRPPGHDDTLFVWQVAVHASARGQGLARQMLDALLQRCTSPAVRFIETTITADNAASWGLFTGLAARRQAELVRRVMFDREHHFDGEHDSEMLVRIGPLRHAHSAQRS